MTVTLALPKLFDDVVAVFAEDGFAVPNVFGWREPSKRGSTPRIVWVPGDDLSGDAGKMAPARNPGGSPRSLATLLESFTVYCSASDSDSPENELAQYKVARLLFDAWHRAVYLSAHGTTAIESVTWVVDKKERRFGAAIRVVGTVQSALTDAPKTFAEADAKADIDVKELDVIEPIHVGYSTPTPNAIEMSIAMSSTVTT